MMRCHPHRRSLRLTVLTLLTVTFAPSIMAAPPDLDSPEVQSRIRGLVQPFVDAKRVAGVSLGVISGDKQATFHFGVTRGGGKAPNDQTVYEIGSITKVFTGILLADAVARGDAYLDQQVLDFLPEGQSVPQFEDTPITLIDLSTHRSGLPPLPNNMRMLRSDNPYVDYDSKLALEFLGKFQLRTKPGEKMQYSNFAASLLGHLLCRSANLTYDDLLEERIAGPLGMIETTVVKNTQLLKRLAQGHDSNGAAVPSWEFADLPGAGGIRSTVPDMLRFAKANLNPPQNDIGKAIQLAWKQHRPAQDNQRAMGLGWMLAGDGSTRWHNGQTGGYHSMLLVNRQMPAAVILLSNSARRELDPLAESVIQMLAGLPVEPTQFDQEVAVDPETLKRYAGRYQLAPNVIFTVSVKDGQLMVGLTGQPTFPVYPKSETEFFYKVVKASLVFKPDPDGRFKTVELKQNGLLQSAKRIK